MIDNAALRSLRIQRENTLAARERAFAIQVMSAKACREAKTLENEAYTALQDALQARDAAYTVLNTMYHAGVTRTQRLRSQMHEAQKVGLAAIERAEQAQQAGDQQAFVRHFARAKSHTNKYEEIKGRLEAFTQEYGKLNTQYHKELRPRAEEAQRLYDKRKKNHDALRTTHETNVATYEVSVEANELANSLYQAALGSLRALVKDRDRARAVYAKVPARYLNRVTTWIGSDGEIHIYFAGLDQPLGPGHGHYIIGTNGKVFYRRDPMMPHGPQNYVNHPRHPLKRRPRTRSACRRVAATTPT